MSERGVTLLETMVALVILGLVVGAHLEVFGGTLRSAARAGEWTEAVAHAEAGMELAKLDLAAATGPGTEAVGSGFRRRIDAEPWRANVLLVTVTVTFPDGGTFVLHRLLEGDP